MQVSWGLPFLDHWYLVGVTGEFGEFGESGDSVRVGVVCWSPHWLPGGVRGESGDSVRVGGV